MKEHTKEPWVHNGDGTIWHTQGCGGQLGRFYREEDARRMVTCVNACAGIPTEQLERGGLEMSLLAAIADIRTALGVGDKLMLSELAREIGKKLGAQEKAAIIYQAALGWISTYAHLTTPELVAEKAYAALVEVDPNLPQWEPHQNMNSVEEANKKLVAEVERLTAERDAAVRERDEAMEALRPFAGLDVSPYKDSRDDRTFYQINETEITVGNLRRARAVLAGIEGERG